MESLAVRPPSPGAAVALVVLVALSAATAVGARGDGGRFTSTRYGYSLTVPAGWVVHPSAAPRPVNSPYFPLGDDPAADRFNSQGSDFGTIAVTATRVRPGLSLNAWSGGTPKRLLISLGCKPKAPTSGKVDGEPAAIFIVPPSCGHTGYASIDYAFAHGGYGYDVQMVSLPAYQARDRAIFERLLKSFRFTR